MTPASPKAMIAQALSAIGLTSLGSFIAGALDFIVELSGRFTWESARIIAEMIPDNVRAIYPNIRWGLAIVDGFIDLKTVATFYATIFAAIIAGKCLIWLVAKLISGLISILGLIFPPLKAIL